MSCFWKLLTVLIRNGENGKYWKILLWNLWNWIIICETIQISEEQSNHNQHDSVRTLWRQQRGVIRITCQRTNLVRMNITVIIIFDNIMFLWDEYYYGFKDKRTLTDFKEPTWLMMFLWDMIHITKGRELSHSFFNSVVYQTKRTLLVYWDNHNYWLYSINVCECCTLFDLSV